MGMDEIIPNLWIGDLQAAQDVETLKSNGIFSVLSAMRGRVRINETFIKHQILLDDTSDTDALVHFLPAIAFIQAELEEKKRGVLVHCQAGMSRSATIVAAYLMYTSKLSPEEAISMIREKRPIIDPNPGFLVQLEIFHNAQFKPSRKDKSTRMFYMERSVEEMMNGDGSLEEAGTLGMFARFPPTPPAGNTPSTSNPPTPTSLPSRHALPKRRIRCKMCRQELATREHMLDHGQLGPPTRRSSEVASRRPSFAMSPASTVSPVDNKGLGRRPSAAAGERRRPSLLMSGLSMTASSPSSESPSRSASRSAARPTFNMTMTMLGDSSAIDSDDEEDQEEGSEDRARRLGRRMSDAIGAAVSPKGEEITTTIDPSPLSSAVTSPNPSKIPNSPSRGGNVNPYFSGFTSPPIIANPKCSGYFVEPMDWMQPELQNGALAGKITCPNKKCGVKLGNYDWAGVCCGCKEWVVPGFCIARNKVDEIV